MATHAVECKPSNRRVLKQPLVLQMMLIVCLQLLLLLLLLLLIIRNLLLYIAQPISYCKWTRLPPRWAYQSSPPAAKKNCCSTDHVATQVPPRTQHKLHSAWNPQARVEAFQAGEAGDIFLLSSGVGGLGLTLTAADRVVIVDPSWNPANNRQSGRRPRISHGPGP